MSPAEAKRLISESASSSRQIFIVEHARARMKERGIDFLDIQRCLINGSVVEGPYQPRISSTNWRVKMAAWITGEHIKVVAEIAEIDTEKVVVITVF